MILTIKSTIDLKVILQEDVTDKQTSAGYYTFDITLPDGIPDGEYEYTLRDGDDILSNGVMTIRGKNGVAKEQYDKETEYEQYTSE